MNRQTELLSPRSEGSGILGGPDFSLAPPAGAGPKPAAAPKPPAEDDVPAGDDADHQDSAPAPAKPKASAPVKGAETKPANGGTKPAAGETKPANGGTKPAAGETKGKKSGTKPPKAERPPAAKEKASPAQKPKPAANPKAKPARSFADHAAAILAHAGREMTAREISKAMAEKDRGGAGAAARVHAAIRDEMGKWGPRSRFKRGTTPNHFVFVAAG